LKRALTLLLLSLSCSRAGSDRGLAGSCLTLTWRSSNWVPSLPHRVKLAQTPDTTVDPKYHRFHLQPVEQGDTLQWAGITNAQWVLQGDSLFLMLRTVDAQGFVALNGTEDSLAGSALFARESGLKSIVQVRAVRESCPARKAGA
jgi:hypothetical protein